MRDACSIVACCMDRNTNLVRAIPSWLTSGAEQIVIVDWHSKEPVKTTLERELTTDYPDWRKQVEIVRVELPHNQRRWVLSWAYNLGVRYARHPWLLKLDSDNVLQPHFLENTLTKESVIESIDWWGGSVYWRGDWRRARTVQQKYLNGTLLVSRSAFIAVGGYSEWIQSYGWEDSALQNALETTLGLKPISIDPEMIDHLPHDDDLRVGVGRNTFAEIHRNRFLDRELKWMLTSPRCRYSTDPESKVVRLVSFPVVPVAHRDRAQRELEQYITVRMTMPLIVSNPLSNPSRALLFVLVRNGLGNKMRALASAYSLFDGINKSKLYNPLQQSWHLVIVWSQDAHCEASMGDLFDLSSVAQEYPAQISITRSLPKVMPSPLLELGDVNLFDEYQSIDSTHIKNMNVLLDTIEKKAKNQEPINVLLESASVISSPFNSWASDCRFLRSLRLSPVVQSLVDQNESRIVQLSGVPLSSMVGVHVRRGQDGTSYDDVSRWSPEKQFQWKKWRSLSTVETFVAEMRALRDKSPDLKFFVASDSVDTFTKMLKHFPPHTLFEQTRTCFDRSVEQVQTALADAVLIGKTKKFLASQWSSYSELCKRLSEVEMLLAGISF